VPQLRLFGVRIEEGIKKMRIKLVIPKLPKSGNKIQNWHYHKRHQYNQDWYDEVTICWRYYQEDHKIPNLPIKRAKVILTFYFPDRRKRDKENFVRGAKPIIDGLIYAGIIKDDNWDDIETQYYKAYDKQYPRTEILVEEISGN